MTLRGGSGQATTYYPGDTVALLVARENPERVQHANWNSGTPTSPVPGRALLLGAAGLVAAVAARAFALNIWRRERDLNPR